MDKNQMYYGMYTEPEQPVTIHAGPVEVIFDNGYIRSVKAENCEIIRRVYMALRDQNWNTIPYTLENLSVNSLQDSFEINFDSIHKSGDIHFVWHGKVTGSAQGEILFSMNGRAESTFERNRIGFCILHPSNLAGQPCEIIKPDESVEEGRFPYLIKPHTPFVDIHKIRYLVSPGIKVEISCEGDIFEMEDQRNWSDASFKTYSTPQSIPKPVTIQRGSSISQSVKISVSATPSQNNFCEPLKDVVSLSIDMIGNPLPQLGLVCDSELIDVPVIERLQSMNLSHLRFNVDAENESLLDELLSASKICHLLNIQAELALSFSQDNGKQIENLLLALCSSQIPVQRFLLISKDAPVTHRLLLDTTRALLKGYSPEAQIEVGTDNYFADINDHHPPLEGADGIFFSVNPQVHTFDNVVIMENAEGQAEILHTARHISGDLPLSISPITIRPRKRVDKPDKAGGADPRQLGLFCSAWTAASLFYCSRGGASSLTYYETVGPGGIMSTDGSSVYPVYHVLSAVSEFAGSNVRLYTSDDPSKVIGMGLILRNYIRWIIVNLTNESQKVSVAGVSDDVKVRFLDETTYESATSNPEGFRNITKIRRKTEDNKLLEELLPYAVMIVDNG